MPNYLYIYKFVVSVYCTAGRKTFKRQNWVLGTIELDYNETNLSQVLVHPKVISIQSDCNFSDWNQSDN